MKNIIWGIFCLIVLFSCVQKKDNEQKPTLISNFVSISDNEDKGIKEILAFYGGECKYSIGRTASTKKGKKKFFELEVRKSEIVDKYSQVAELPASNIAYLFYRNLEKEKVKYDEIHAVLVFANGEKITFKYPSAQLEQVVRRMALTDKIIAILKSKDYDALRPYVNNTTVFQFNKDDLINGLKKHDPQFGTISEFKPFGFKISSLGTKPEQIHITGILIREIQNTAFSLDMNLNSEIDEIYNLQYQF